MNGLARELELQRNEQRNKAKALRKENKGLKYSNKELVKALKTLKEDLPWGQGDCLTKVEFIDITLKGTEN